MKWNPIAAVQEHAARVLADPKSKPEDCVSARRAIADPYGPEALAALDDETLRAMQAEHEAALARIFGGHCVRCGGACVACAEGAVEADPPRLQNGDRPTPRTASSAGATLSRSIADRSR